jgi:hypothetical protein
MEVNMTKVKDLISGDIVLVQDTQDRMAALEYAGLDADLLQEYPTLFSRSEMLSFSRFGAIRA